MAAGVGADRLLLSACLLVLSCLQRPTAGMPAAAPRCASTRSTPASPGCRSGTLQVWWGVVEDGQPPKQIIEGGEFFVLKRMPSTGGHH